MQLKKITFKIDQEMADRIFALRHDMRAEHPAVNLSDTVRAALVVGLTALERKRHK